MLHRLPQKYHSFFHCTLYSDAQRIPCKRGNIWECCVTSCHSTASRILAVFPSLLSPSTHLITHHARPRRDRREPVSSLIPSSRMLSHTRSICSRTSEGNSSVREDETGSIRQNGTNGERFAELYHTSFGRLSTQLLGRRSIGTMSDQVILRNTHFRGAFCCVSALYHILASDLDSQP